MQDTPGRGDSPIIETAQGRIRGRNVDGVHCFHGVPYAAPPVGEARFKAPGPAMPWQGVLDASRPATVAPQLPSRLGKVTGEYPAEVDEDCLRLEIWRPAHLPPEQPLPVMVFLHGGAYMTGGGALPCYDGALLAKAGDMVVVNVSYRLGILGFLAIPGIAPPNLGLYDQCAALRWVRRHIGAWGGDAGNVTVVGQSAGGYSIALMLAHANGPELFDRAVMMSAPLGIAPYTEGQALAIGQSLLDLLDGDASGLRTLPMAQILALQGRLLRHHLPEPGEFTPIFFPSLDGDWVKANPAQAIQAGAARGCDIMVGYTREEAAAFYYQDADLASQAQTILPRLAREAWGGQAAARLRAIHNARAGSALEMLTDLQGLRIFVDDSLALAQRACEPGRSTYVYQFDWSSPQEDSLGACHCMDLPFLFGNFDTWAAQSPMVRGVEGGQLRALGERFQRQLAGFVRSGRPGLAGDQHWPACGAGRAVMHFDRLCQVYGHTL